MTRTIAIAPVRKSIRVKVSQSHAFDVFTAGLGRWWPTTHSIGKPPMKTAVLEPRLGGRWYELSEDGSQADVGRVLAREPPHRVVISWDINDRWQPDTTVASEIEVQFIAEGPRSTRVEMEHRKFEALGQQGGEQMRRDVDGGWPGLLDLYKREAEASSNQEGEGS